MIPFIILIILLACTLAVVMLPLVRESSITAKDSLTRELEASQTQLSQIDEEVASGFLDDQGAKRARRAMEKRIAKLHSRLTALETAGDEPTLAGWIKIGVPVFLIGCGVVLYPLIGSPSYEREAEAQLPMAQNAMTSETLQNMTLPEIEDMLVQRLTAAPDPRGFILLGRVRLEMNQFEGSLLAYEEALRMTENDPRVMEEYQQAQAIIDRLTSAPDSSAPDISDDQMAAMNQLSQEDQQAQINAMVEGLAARLDADPSDLNGWLRLIRARAVLGQTEEAQQALSTAENQFADDENALSALSALASDLSLE
ncbi:c-type cytochrome biogenesis protein CcmI [Ponticaulis sp.]|uniref:c-type cytochrome biogenesis protein CcmI n=1 Tax=Ponticaulis sp. TaxID=2020902 RepID=UPI000B753F1E|nr:c-type cytochrome biogenesis protein CcmI [Ponticaulis sp.]MAI90064.1 c-type cytochrome biogenesis protein CcmI [Ponticaulis sp.]OUX99720.1 MAG: c-type cytochrome biogenesis protein CcmI [Hyphomonadaceae bacterium TMED5]|tara:strand:- start:20204 stop:21139 length:936 start_codon:yes stop_codon:yes gene_type:complete